MRTFILALIFFFSSIAGFGQVLSFDSVTVNWEMIPEPEGEIFSNFYRQDSTVFAVNYGSRNYSGPDVFVYKTEDKGENWTALGAGGKNQFFCANDSFLFKAETFGLLRIDRIGNVDTIYKTAASYSLPPPFPNASSWFAEKIINLQAEDSIVSFDYHQAVWQCSPGGCGIYNLQWHGAYVSTDYGKTWKIIHDARRGPFFSKEHFVVLSPTRISAVHKSDPDLSGSVDLPPVHVNSEPWDYIRYANVLNGCINIFSAAIGGGLKKQTFCSGTNSWTPLSDEIFSRESIHRIRTKDDLLYVATETGLYKEILPESFEFEQIYSGNVTLPGVYDFHIIGEEILASTYSSAVIQSKDSGANWTLFHQGRKESERYKFVPFGSDLLSYTYDGGVFSLKNGTTKFEKDSRIPYGKNGNVVFGDTILAANKFDVKRTVDGGKTWETKLENSNSWSSLTEILKVGNRIIVKNWNDVYVSKDKGETWERTNNKWEKYFASNDTIIGIYEGDLFRSTDYDKTRQDLFPKGENFHTISKIAGNWVAVASGGRIFISKNGGDSWLQTNDTFDESNDDVFIADKFIFKSFYKDQKWYFLVSKDFGKSWNHINRPLNFNIENLFAYGNYICFHPYTDDLYRIKIADLDSLIKIGNENFGFILGKVFIDENRNDEPDSNEILLKNRTIKFEPGPRYAVSSETGLFGASLIAGNNDITAPTLRYHQLWAGSQTTSINISKDSLSELNIAYQPIPDNPDLAVNVWSQNRLRPGFDVVFLAEISNLGTEIIQNGNLEFSFPSQFLTIKDMPVGATANGDKITVPIAPIALYGKENLKFTFTIKTTTPLSTPVTILATISDDFGDKNLTDNSTEETFIVTGSFDPNDKTLLSGNELIPDDYEFEYLIRFQNTGTDTAFRVVVRDTLHGKLDPFSLDVVQASHSYDLKIEDERVLVWTFNDILLPDSTTNEPESHGFIRFNINTKYPLLSTEKLENTAAIYFDFNLPVITEPATVCGIPNYVYNELNRKTCKGWSIRVFDEYIEVFSDSIFRDTFRMLYKDSVVTLNVQVFDHIDTTINLYVVPGEEFDYIPIYSDTMIIRELSTENWCDSIVTYNISLLTSTDDLSEKDLSVKIFPNPNSGKFYLEFELPEPMELSVDLTDIHGRLINSVVEKSNYKKGSVRVLNDSQNLALGIYFLHFKTRSDTFLKKIIIDR